MDKLKKQIDNLGLNFRREMSILFLIQFIFLVLCFGVFLFTRRVASVISVLCINIFITFLYAQRYKVLSDAQCRLRQDEFISIFTFFKIYFKNGFSVYGALKEISTFVSDDLKEKFDTLLGDIDEDKSVQPFVKFAHEFDNLLIEQLMISVYQLVDEGNESNYYHQFELIFSGLEDDYYESQIVKKDEQLSKMTMFPLLGATLLIVLITIGVVTVIEVMLSGV